MIMKSTKIIIIMIIINLIMVIIEIIITIKPGTRHTIIGFKRLCINRKVVSYI